MKEHNTRYQWNSTNNSLFYKKNVYKRKKEIRYTVTIWNNMNNSLFYKKKLYKMAKLYITL